MHSLQTILMSRDQDLYFSILFRLFPIPIDIRFFNILSPFLTLGDLKSNFCKILASTLRNMRFFQRKFQKFLARDSDFQQGWARDGTGQSRDFLSRSRLSRGITIRDSPAKICNKIFGVIK